MSVKAISFFGGVPPLEEASLSAPSLGGFNYRRLLPTVELLSNTPSDVL